MKGIPSSSGLENLLGKRFDRMRDLLGQTEWDFALPRFPAFTWPIVHLLLLLLHDANQVTLPQAWSPRNSLEGQVRQSSAVGSEPAGVGPPDEFLVDDGSGLVGGLGALHVVLSRLGARDDDAGGGGGGGGNRLVPIFSDTKIR